MIEVNELSKDYVGKTAVDRLTFQVQPGEVVGFIGPNGAGKSTTMKMLTGYLPPTSGTAKVNGFDVFHDSVKARQSVGYMPENAPLYLDMRVNEYLAFRGALKGVKGKHLKQRLHDVMEACALLEVRRKIIGGLSKGFRQRVALADALISQPPLLILDEPTNGLDPNQIRQVRELLYSHKTEQTIFISTHILSEVETYCDRVLIMHKGKLRADDAPKHLVRNLRVAGDLIVEVRGGKDYQTAFSEISGIRRLNVETLDQQWTRLTLRVEARSDLRAAINELAMKQQWELRELHRQLPSLEDVFTELTAIDG